MSLLTTKQAAELLGITPRTLQTWRYLRKGPEYVRINSKVVRYNREDIDKWVRQNETK